jgi:hypothetical protein
MMYSRQRPGRHGKLSGMPEKISRSFGSDWYCSCKDCPHRNTSHVLPYGSDIVRVRVSGGSVFGDMKNGRTAEYVNGSPRRTF